jgi:hypothetical protein
MQGIPGAFLSVIYPCGSIILILYRYVAKRQQVERFELGYAVLRLNVPLFSDKKRFVIFIGSTFRCRPPNRWFYPEFA